MKTSPITLPTFEWNPISGCSPISVGCANCYAQKVVAADPSRAMLTNSQGHWTGAVRFNPDQVEEPLFRSARHLVFVCPHGDLFHERAEPAWIDRAFNVMERSPQHVFQVLTKRAARMREFVAARYSQIKPPSHIQFGVSVERQQEAIERIPHLLAIGAKVRYITLFPLLGMIDLRVALGTGKINFVIAGAEAQRPPDQAWIEQIAEHCRQARVPFQFGARLGLEIEGRAA